MYRATLALGIVLLVTSVVAADVPPLRPDAPPPPPPVPRELPVDHKITTDKDYANYAFFTITGLNRVAPVKLDPKTPLELLAKDRGGRFFSCTLVAVPKGAGKKYDSEREFFAAIVAGKVEGQINSKPGFYPQSEVKDTDKRSAITMEYKLVKIDVKEGIVFLTKNDEPKGGDGKDTPEDAGAPVSARTPRGGVWMAGLAATLALVLGGLWVASRGRRRLSRALPKGSARHKIKLHQLRRQEAPDRLHRPARLGPVRTEPGEDEVTVPRAVFCGAGGGSGPFPALHPRRARWYSYREQ